MAKAHVELFYAGGPACRLLITIRNADVESGLGPLFASRHGRLIKPSNCWKRWARAQLAARPPNQDSHCTRLGYLPLAVRLAGAQLQMRLLGNGWKALIPRELEITKKRRSATSQLTWSSSSPREPVRVPIEGQCLLYEALSIFQEDETDHQHLPSTASGSRWHFPRERQPQADHELAVSALVRSLGR